MANEGRVLAKEGKSPLFTDMNSMMDHYFPGSAPGMDISKAAGGFGVSVHGAFRSYMGRLVTSLVLTSDNFYASIGARPWDQTGLRVQRLQAQKGGIGARRGGNLPDSVRPDVEYIQEPYKELPYKFEFDLGLENLEGKDDVVAYADYIELHGKSYADDLDYDALRPVSATQAVDAGEEIGLERLSRIVSSFGQVGTGTPALTGDQVSPWGGTVSDIYPYRNAAASGFDANVIDKAGSQLEQEDLYDMWTAGMPNWDMATVANKMWLTSPEAQRIIASQLAAQGQRFLETVYVSRDVNGVKTLEGRDGGFVLSSFMNIPWVIDPNLVIDKTTQMIPSTRTPGDVYLLDQDHMFNSVLKPTEFRTTDRYELTEVLANRAVFQTQAELRADKFLCHVKLTGATS